MMGRRSPFKLLLVWGAVILAAALMACNLPIIIIIQTATPVATITPSPTPTLLYTPNAAFSKESLNSKDQLSKWKMIIRDDFTSNLNRWVVGAEETSEALFIRQVVDAQYLWEIRGKRPVFSRSLFSSDPVGDFALSVDVKRAGGSLKGFYGLIFRVQDNGNLYYFGISDLENYSFTALIDGKWNLISKSAQKTSAVKTGEINHIGVIGEGSLYRLFINGVEVGKFTDRRLVKGHVGLAADLSQAGEDIFLEFDNFELRTPAQVK
ncbi:MAG TPA: family 16 glycoside hydrolase [Anaerolineaceae bacterium]